jgi:hypothetical protein
MTGLTAANNGHLRERQNMRAAARHDAETGNWAVIATLPNGRETVAVANLDSEERAEEAAENLRTSERAGYQNSDLRPVLRE